MPHTHKITPIHIIKDNKKATGLKSKPIAFLISIILALLIRGQLA